jgi:WD40 repeat protein
MNMIVVTSRQGRVSCISSAGHRDINEERIFQLKCEGEESSPGAAVNCVGTEIAYQSVSGCSITVLNLECNEHLELGDARCHEIRYSPTLASILMVLHRPGNVKIWNTELRRVLSQFTASGGYTYLVRALCFRPCFSEVVLGTYEGCLEIWDSCLPTTADDLSPLAKTCMQQQIQVHKKSLTCVSVRCDGFMFASESLDGTISVAEVSTVSAATGRSTHRTRLISGHKDSVNCVIFSSCSNIMVSGSADKTVKMWEASTGANLAVFEHRDSISALCFCDDGRYLYCAAANNSIYVWSLEESKSCRMKSGAEVVGELDSAEVGEGLCSSCSVSTACAVFHTDNNASGLCPLPSLTILM